MAPRPEDARAARPLTPGRVPSELERRIVSVLFCDLAGFTSLSERLDPEDVATVQGAYFEAVRDAVTRHGGTLEKFIGDAAVAVYGVPLAREDDAERAVRSGLAIVGAVEQLSASRAGGRRARGAGRAQSGEAVVHPSPPPGEAMVTGDVVNTAARLQAAAPLGAVLLGGGTALAVASSVELEEVGGLTLKGKAEPVRAYRAVAALPEPERERAMGELRARTVGRDDELGTLSAALEECAQGATRRVTVVAPPGTGKSPGSSESSPGWRPMRVPTSVAPGSDRTPWPRSGRSRTSSPRRSPPRASTRATATWLGPGSSGGSVSSAPASSWTSSSRS